jgi:hypothetical protein
MAKQKGTNIVALRELFKEQGVDLEKDFLKQLSTECQRLYKMALATTMTDVKIQTAIYVAAAQTLYPHSVDPLYELGLELANRSFKGIYRLFIRIPTPSFVINKAAAIWSTYYDTGVTGLEHVTKNSGDFLLKDIPELPKEALHYIGGHAVKLLQLAGAQNVRLDIHDQNENCWRLKLHWD